MSINEFCPNQGRAGFLGGVDVFGNSLQIIKTDAESITFQVHGLDSETAFRELERHKSEVFGFGPNWSLGPLQDAASRAGACEWRMGQFQVMRPSDGQTTGDIYIRWLGTPEQRKEYAAGFLYW